MYERVQKPSSSFHPSIQKKKSKYGPRTFSVQPRRETKSSQPPVPSYSPDAANRLYAKLKGSMEAPVQRQTDALASSSQLEQGTTPVEEAVAVSQQSQEIGIQRQCSECKLEQHEQVMEERKDSDEMSLVAGVQTKLTVGTPGDKYEQEADRVALQVMTMPEPATKPQPIQLQGEEEEALQRQSLAASITPLVQCQEEDDAGTIGKPGFAESLIPIWGSGREAIYDFQKGNWGWGLVNAGLAVTDIFLVKSLATAAGKALVKGGAKGVAELAAKEAAEKAAKEAAEKAAKEAAEKAAKEAEEKAAKEAAEKAAKEAEEKAAKEAEKKIAECQAIHAAYKALGNCTKCEQSDTPEVRAKKIACITAALAGRQEYLRKRCDYILPGSIARGSGIAETGHEKQVEQLVKMLAKCSTLPTS